MARLQAKANEDRATLGITLILTAWGCFSFIDASAKWMSLFGFAALQLVFLRYVGHFIISTALIARGGISWDRFATEKPMLVIVRGVLLLGSSVFNFIAVRYLPLTLTSTILFSSPIIVCALSWPLLGERVGPWRWGAIMFGFFGILIAVQPFGDEFHWAVLLSIAGATCFSFYAILTRMLSDRIASDTLQFYSGLVGTLATLPFAILFWKNPETVMQLVAMIALGFFGWIGHELLTRAHRFATASVLTPFSYSFLIYLTIWSFFLFDHLPDKWTIMGALVIVVSGMTIWLRERRKNAD